MWKGQGPDEVERVTKGFSEEAMIQMESWRTHKVASLRAEEGLSSR